MQIAQRMENLPMSAIRQIFNQVAAREAAGEKFIHLEIGRPDFDTPAHIKAAAAQALEAGKVHYTSNYGILELRQALAKKFQRDNGLTYNPEDQIIATVGSTEAVMMAMMALLNPGDEVLIPLPCFPLYIRAAHMAGAVPVMVPLREENGFVPSVEDYRAGLTDKTRMMVVNTPHNPTGAVCPPRILEGLAGLAVEADLIVLSDEIYEKNIYEGGPHVSLATFEGMFERTLTINGFSKAYSMTGWRLGYVAGPTELISALVRVAMYTTVCPTTFVQWGGVAALEGPQDCIEEMQAEFDRRRLMVNDRLAAMPGLTFAKPGGAFYFFINITQLGKSPREIAAYLLDEAKISLVPWGEEHIRISYANSYENLTQAMDNMERALGKLG
jgi:aspartate/methionine/tyrosine aminotransferase